MMNVCATTLVIFLFCISNVVSYPPHVMKEMIATGTWAPPGPGDTRGPCPGLNTLANYGYLPRSGRNISVSTLAGALEEVYNFSTALALSLSTNAVIQDGSWGSLSLDELDNHATLEHDASMTRDDYYFGNNYAINVSLLSDLLSASSDDNVLDEDDFAYYQSVRQNSSKANNPTYTFGFEQRTFASGEPALILTIFGDLDETSGSYNISLSAVKTFLGLEQFPEGWTSPDAEVTIPLITSMSHYIASKWTSN